MKEIANQGDKRMTVKEVATALGVSERVVQMSIKRLCPEAVANGKTTWLTERHVTEIKMDLQRHHNLEGTFEVATTDLEMTMKAAEVVAWAMAKIEEQKTQLAEAKPKIEFFDAVTESTDTIDMGEVAKVLNIPGFGRNNLFAFLRGKKILMSDNTPYQTYIDRGYFKIVENSWETPSGLCHVNMKPVVYQKGLDFIRKIIMENN